MSIQFESINCNLCESNDFKPFLIREDLNLRIPGKFKLVKCNKCGLIYQNPRPIENDIGKIYLENYDQYLFNQNQNNFIKNYSYFKRLKRIQKYKQNGNLLDIGCATGEFLNYIQLNTKFNVCGLEPNLKAASYAKDHYSLDIVNSTLDNANLNSNYFDVITFWNVLEHFPDPKSTLKMIHSILKPDGIIVFNTPIINSFDYKVFNKYWIGFELPRHFYIFSFDSLNQLLSFSDIKIIETSAFYGEHASFMSSLIFWLRAISKSKSTQSIIEKILFSLPIRILFIPLFYIIEKLHLASIPTFICKTK